MVLAMLEPLLMLAPTKGKGDDDDVGAGGGGARAATSEDVHDAGADKRKGDGDDGGAGGEKEEEGVKAEDPDWVRTGVGSKVFLRRRPGPAVEYDAEELHSGPATAACTKRCCSTTSTTTHRSRCRVRS